MIGIGIQKLFGKQLYGAGNRIEKFVAFVFAVFAIYIAVSFSLSRFPGTQEISSPRWDPAPRWAIWLRESF
jgi:hypothetical protein